MGVNQKPFQYNVDIISEMVNQDRRSFPVLATADGATSGNLPALVDPDSVSCLIQGEFVGLDKNGVLKRVTEHDTLANAVAHAAGAGITRYRWFMNYAVRGNTDAQHVHKVEVLYRQSFDVVLDKVYDPDPQRVVGAAAEASFSWAVGTPVWAKYFALADNPLTGDVAGPRMLISGIAPNDDDYAAAVQHGLVLGHVTKIDGTKLTIHVARAA